jgi:N-acetylmuramoyl-L-alanine amidase
MKNTLKDIGGIVVDILLTVIIATLVGYAALCGLAYSAFPAETITADERVVALTILGEARGEGNQGMYAVACIIQERADKRKLTPAGVCLQPWQFSVWNAGKGKVKKESELHHLWKSKSTPYAKQLAHAICRGWKLTQDFTGNANHYYSSDRKNPPYWTFKKEIVNGKEIKKAIKPTRRIGKHIFYKL